MSDWNFLNKHRHKGGVPGIMQKYTSEDSDGFNGLFRFALDGRNVRVIASDGEGWRHVSVTIEGDTRTPTWGMMCKIKDLFWDPYDWVVQFHPAHSEYVNNHQGCLHLWQPTDLKFPTPNSLLVGIKPQPKEPMR